MRAILSARAAYAVVKEAEVTANERTAVIITRKPRGEIGIVSMGDAEVLGPSESARAGGTEEADDAGSGSMAVGAVDVGMWGSSF